MGMCPSFRAWRSGGARAALEAVIEHLQAVLDELPEGEQHDDDDVAHVRTRVGMPKFREPARVLKQIREWLARGYTHRYRLPYRGEVALDKA